MPPPFNGAPLSLIADEYAKPTEMMGSGGEHVLDASELKISHVLVVEPAVIRTHESVNLKHKNPLLFLLVRTKDRPSVPRLRR